MVIHFRGQGLSLRTALLHRNFLFMCNAFVFCLKKQAIFFRKSCADFNFISHIHSYVYIHIALCSHELYLQDSCHNLAMPHSV